MSILNKHVFTNLIRLWLAAFVMSALVCLLAPGSSYAQGAGAIQLKKKTVKKRIDAKGNLVTEEALVEDLYNETNVGSIAQLDPRANRAFFTHTWYIKASTTVNYFNLGSEFQGVIRQIEGAFGGDALNMKLLNVNADFSMTTGQKVKRAPTYFLPTGNLALGFYFGKHQVELEFGLAGLVPLKTIDLDTTMTLRDQTAGCSGTACQMASLGFVDPVSRTGQYAFRMTMNEDVWILTPSLAYDYVFLTRKWGRMSLGGAAGAMILSTSQQIAFKAVRTDPITPTPPEKPLESRILQGSASSTNVTDIGPIFRMHVTYRPPPLTKFWNTQMEVRLGANYGYVYLNRDVDGVGQAVLGDTLYGTFPLTSLGFKSKETNKFEMLGGFIQVGIIF